MSVVVLLTAALAASAPDPATLSPTPETSDTPAPVAPDLRGTWRLDLYVVSHARIPVLGTTTILAHTTFLATIDGPIDAQVLHTTPCALSPKTTRPIAETIIPDAFVANLPRKHVPLSLRPRGADEWSLSADMQVQDVGWSRSAFTPSSDQPLPESSEHPAVVDFEQDGHPGATILLDAPIFGEIEIYVVQTAHTYLSATVSQTDVVAGRADPRSFAQHSIGASNRLFVTNPDIELDRRQSRFRLGRVPADTTCGALKAGLGAGVPLRPEDVRPKP